MAVKKAKEASFKKMDSAFATSQSAIQKVKNSFFRYEGLKLYLFWGGMVCNILVFLMLAYSLFGK